MTSFSAIGVYATVKLASKYLLRTSLFRTVSIHNATSQPSQSLSTKSVPPLSKRNLENDYEEYKMVILIRTDLEMTKGKIVAQCCHAVMAAYKYVAAHQLAILQRWEACGQPKVALKVKDEPEMMALLDKAHEIGLCAKSIKDAGKTQVAPGSRTVVAIGPGPISLVDFVTGHLKLY